MDRNRKIMPSNLDYILILVTFVCVILGFIVLTSAVHSLDGGRNNLIIQGAGIIIGIAAMFIVASIDYEYFGDLKRLIYIISVVLLIVVLIIGSGESIGSKSWIRIGPVGIQPAELVKIGFIITFAKHVSEVDDDINNIFTVIKLVLHMGILLGLIMLQPDFGTAMVFICIFIGILIFAGISYKYVIAAILLLLIIAPIAWFFFLDEYQKNRITVFLNPELDPAGTGYNVLQSKIAIGSGQIFGKGLFRGTQTQLGYLPARHTDFIFAVIGEELGLIGCISVVGLLFTIVFRAISNARQSKNSFGSYICIGVAFMLIGHIFENVGMCIGIMPVTGIPLPFFSYGGSSIITNFIAVGLLLNVYMRRKTINF